MKDRFAGWVALAFVAVACGGEMLEEPAGDTPDTTPGVERKPSHDAALGGTGAALDVGQDASVNDDGRGGAGGSPDESADGGASPVEGPGNGETNISAEPEVLALESCDLAAPFEAPVAAFTGSMDADGLAFSADGLRAYISGAGPGNRDIYVATRSSPDGIFGAPTLVTAVNTSGIERAPSLSPDGKLYFTKQPSSMFDIGRAVGTAPDFTNAEVVPAPISSGYQDEDPFWWGNDTLYFVSEVDNGGAHRDIWMATLNGTTFSQPEKVQGQGLNSSEEEFRPILSPDGLTLYFASKRFGIGSDSQGDVWMARRTSATAPVPPFAAPVNLWGLNSTGTDFPVTVSADGCTLYFASNEETGLGNSPNLRLYQATRGTSTPAQVTLRLNILGQGSVTSPFACGPGNTGTCSASAPPDTTMIVWASAPAQWTGSCTGNGGTPSTDGVVVFSQNAVCTVKFPGGNLAGQGGLCSLSMDCQQGLACVNGTCSCTPGMQCSEQGDTCSADADCQTGLVCWLEGARHFDKPGGTGVCAPPICRTSVVAGGCGDLSQPCGRCEGTPRPCTTNADCVTGEVCGTNNGAAFGLAPDGDFCWPPDCNTPATTPARCGTVDTACGICDCSANCAGRACGDPTGDGCGGECTGLCDDHQPCTSSLSCPAGSVCGLGVGPRFGLPAGTSACWPADCAEQDPALPNGGVDPVRCGVSPPCAPTCELGDTGPDGCGGFCDDCAAGEVRHEDGVCAPPVSFIHRSGVDLPEPFDPMPTNEVGATPGAFSVTDGGKASYSIDLRVSPGRLGVQPNLALRYVSTKANGMLGIGWSLAGLSTITRCPKIHDRDGAGSPIGFGPGSLFCLDGRALMKIGTGTYGDDGVEYRTEIDSFSKVVSHGSATDAEGHYVGPAWFEVRTKDGGILTFGRRGFSKVLVHGGPVARVWALNRVEDRAGNYLDIAYKSNLSVRVRVSGEDDASEAVDTGELLPERISYGGNRSDATSGLLGRRHSRFVSFEYEDRTDPMHHYVAGTVGYSKHRLTRIDTLVGGELVKSYELGYEARAQDDTSPSQLESVRECGNDAEGERRCLKPTRFEYFPQTSFGPVRATGRPTGEVLAVLDQNGDGLDDVAYVTPVAQLGELRWQGAVASPTPGNVSEGLPFTGFDLGVTAKCIGADSVIDLNRDGRDDLIDLCAPLVYLASANGMVPTPINVPDTGTNRKRLADFDGDGLRDLVTCHEIAGQLQFSVERNTGSDFVPLGLPEIEPSVISASCKDFIALDIQGDGSDEFVLARSTVTVGPPGSQVMGAAGMKQLVFSPAPQQTGGVGSWISIGQNLPSVTARPDGSEVANYRMLDFNGDGLKDFLAFDGTTFSYWMNTGGRYTVQHLSIRSGPGAGAQPSGFDRAIVMDRDGDGRDDLILPPLWYRLAEPGVVEVAGDLGLPTSFGVSATGVPADLDGDGSQEIAYRSPLDGNLRFVESAGSGKTRLLRLVTDGLGRRSTVEYEGLYDPPIDARHPQSPATRNWIRTLTPSAWTCQPTSTTRCLNKAGPLVSTNSASQLFPDSPSGQPASPGPTILYQYFGPRLGLGGRGAFGFSQRIVENPLSRTNTAFHNDDFRLAGRPSISETRPVSAMPSPLGGEEPIELVTFEWGIFQSGAQRPFPFLVSQTSTTTNGFSDREVVKRTEMTRAPDAFGNELSLTVRTSSRDALIDETIVSTFPVSPNTSSWIVGLTDSRIVTSTRNEESRRRVLDYSYDLERMLLTSVERHGGPLGASDATQHRITSFVPDAFGNIEETCIDGQGGPERCMRVLSRDAENIFPRQVRDAENMTSEYIFAVEDGQLLAAIDPNGTPSERAFDAFGRLQQVSGPTSEGKFTYSAQTRTGTVFQSVFIDGAIAVTSAFVGKGERVSIFDAFGRLVQTQSPGFDGVVIHQDRQYDALGRLVAVSAPHDSTNNLEGLTTFAYDGVGRLAKVTEPDGNFTEYFYTNVRAANTTYSFFIGDEAATLSVMKLPRGNTRMIVRDPLGQVLRTAEAAGIGRSSETQTSFARGPFGAVHRVAKDGGATTYDIDDWGRTRSSFDPALGERQFVHNGFDELVQETDARGEVDTYEYDDLGRLVEKRDGGGEVIARWDFDGDPAFGQQGRLVASWRRAATGSDTGTWILNRYEGPKGLPSAAEYHVGATLTDPAGGDVFQTKYAYDQEVPARLSEVTYPSNGGEFRIGYHYDSTHTAGVWSGSGAIKSVVDQTSQASALWTLTEADEGYRLGSEEFGNGVVSTRSYYDPVECLNQPGRSCAGRLKNITTGLPAATPFAAKHHAWDANGNLTALDSLEFEYDSLDRLVREHVVVNQGGPGEQDVTLGVYAYNDAGDFTSKAGAGTYTYQPRGPIGAGSELRSVGDTTYWYDENGNQTERIGSLAEGGYQELDYNDFDMPHQIITGEPGIGRTTTSLEYTSSGQRVRERTTQTGVTTERVYVGDIYQRTENSITPLAPEHRYKVLVGSRQVAEVVRHGSDDDTDDVVYLHDDHLGSVTAVTDAGAAVVETRSYGAFGGQTTQGAATGVRSSFTGHDQDTAVGLVNARGRLYDPVIGRFITADPFTANPGSSQGWNRYSYVENNPLAFTDPSGFAQCQWNAVCGDGECSWFQYCTDAPPPNYQGDRAAGEAQADNARREAERQASANAPGYHQPSLSDYNNLPGQTNVRPDGGGEGAPNQPDGTGGTGPGPEPGPALPRGCLPGVCGADDIGIPGKIAVEAIALSFVPIALPTRVPTVTTNVERALTAEQAAIIEQELGLLPVATFTDLPTVALIERSGFLKAGTWVTLPSEVAGMTASTVEKGLEIAAGRGTAGATFATPASNLLVPAVGPTTSGGFTQFRLLADTPIPPGSFIPYR